VHFTSTPSTIKGMSSQKQPSTDRDKKIITVFISGAGLDTSIWNEVIKNIETPSICIDYTQLRTDNPKASLEDYVQQAYDQYLDSNSDTVIVVAHSIGGLIATELINKLGDKCKALVLVCAAVPKPGHNFISVLPFPQKFIMPAILRLVGTKPPDSQIKTGLASDLQEQQANKIAKQFKPESRMLFTDNTSKQPLLDIPTSYILTTKDKELDAATQRSIVKNLRHPTVTEIDSGHMPMVSNPRSVAKIIQDTFKSIN
jgi:pimeloyl-ACP methyl ester carboxylesterase